MKILCTLFSLVALFLFGCEQADDTGSAGASADSHRDAVSRFQDGQNRFKSLVATIRDEKSFDEARPELDRIVADWHNVAAVLRKFEPPSEEEQLQIRKMIAEGHRRTEPTTEDMMSLISIESRESEITKWLEDLAMAAGEVGAELTRLYGSTDYSGSESDSPEIDLSSATFKGVPLDEVLNEPATFLQQNNQEARQGVGGQPTTPPPVGD